VGLEPILVGEQDVELLLVGEDLGLGGQQFVELGLVGLNPLLVGEDPLLIRDYFILVGHYGSFSDPNKIPGAEQPGLWLIE
jgi:hypothetical protein